MASLKVKLSPSNVPGQAGTIFYHLTHNKETRRIATDIHLYPHQWRPFRERVDPSAFEAGRLQAIIDRDCRKLRRLVAEFDARCPDYTVADIVRSFLSSDDRPRMLAFMEEQIGYLKSCNRFSTARNYERTLCSFSQFLGTDIPIASMTEQLIDEYNAFLNRRGVVRNTVSFYMRVLRSVYNKAVRRRLTEPQEPFRNVYTGIDRTRKRAVDKQIIARLNRMDLSASAPLALARDLFMFSFYTRGMSFIDIVHLKRSDLQGDMIRYVRRKTGQQLTVRIEPSIRAIIDRYAACSHPYVFPILTSKEPCQAFASYQNALTCYNRRLKKLAEMVGLDAPLSSYCARHSWATTARNLQVPLSVISAGMGHTSERTTQIYLTLLEDSVIDEANYGVIGAVDQAAAR